MTCKELHGYWENRFRAATNVRLDSAEFAEHIAACSECNRFIEEQQEVAKCLHVVRDSAPAIPLSLDTAVVAKYQSYMSERSCAAVSAPLTHRINQRAALGWAAAAAFAVLVAYGGALLLIPRQQVWVDRQDTARPPVVPQAQRMANKETAVARTRNRKLPKSRGSLNKPGNGAEPVAEQDNSFPTRFQSLMYCDQISCPGAMEVIRVQLPAPVLGLAPASARTNGVVFADVLIGPDGIARGIRVVE